MFIFFFVFKEMCVKKQNRNLTLHIGPLWSRLPDIYSETWIYIYPVSGAAVTWQYFVISANHQSSFEQLCKSQSENLK